MASRLSTERVFLDTQVFIAAQFNYKNEAFRALYEHIKNGRVQLFLTDLTIREIDCNLERMVAETLNAFSSARKKAMLPVKNSPAAAGLFAQPDEAAITKEALADFHRFLEECRPTVLPVKESYLKPILDDYFARKPPFGEGKDKAQFPDALAIAALIDYTKHDRTICAVSGDQAFRAACNPLYHLDPYESLPKFLDAVASEDKRAAFIHDLITKVGDIVKPAVKEQFEKLTFDLPYEWGEVHEVHVEDISLGDREASILLLFDAAALVLEYAKIRFRAVGERVVDDETMETHSFRISTTLERQVSLFIKTDYKSLDAVKVDVSLDKGDVVIRLEEP